MDPVADNDCMNSFLFNTRKQLRITIKYTWTKAQNINSLVKYNNNIKQLRENDYKEKKTIDFLTNITLFNEYQDKLAKLISVNNQTVVDELQLDSENEGREDENYEKNIEKFKKNDNVTKDNNFTDE